MTSDRDNAVRELLAFYLEAGVDAVLDERPIDRFADPAPLAPAPGERAPDEIRRVAMPAAQRPAVPIPPAPEAAVMAAREEARNAATLDELRAMLNRFTGCALRGRPRPSSCSPTAIRRHG
jgi:DNA polymerase